MEEEIGLGIHKRSLKEALRSAQLHQENVPGSILRALVGTLHPHRVQPATHLLESATSKTASSSLSQHV